MTNLPGSNLYQDAQEIIKTSLQAVQPDAAVNKSLNDISWRHGNGKVILISIGKAAWKMAQSAMKTVGSIVTDGVVITKYGHSIGSLPGLTIYEAGHPVPDENSFAATEAAIQVVSGLSQDDTVLFLISGGGSALFEKPLVPAAELERITRQLLASGADIVEMNTIRKRLSTVKGGRFAQICASAKIYDVCCEGRK